MDLDITCKFGGQIINRRRRFAAPPGVAAGSTKASGVLETVYNKAFLSGHGGDTISLGHRLHAKKLTKVAPSGAAAMPCPRCHHLVDTLYRIDGLYHR